MSEPKWTPGPWRCDPVLYRGTGYKYCEISSDKSATWIAKVLSYDSTGLSPEPVECAANTDLIAAAPELYEALNAAYKTFYDKDCPLGLQVRAALAKARGEA